MPTNARATKIQLIHIAKSQLALDEDSYRALLKRVAGNTSSAAMSLPQLDKVLDEFRRLGWSKSPARKAGRRSLAADPQSRMIRALWLALRDADKLRDPSEAGLDAFVKRMTGVDSLRFVQDPADRGKLIEALKSWCRREGIELD